MKNKILMMLLAGITLLAACKGSGSSTLMDQASKDTVAQEAHDSVKLVKTADMRFKVKNVQHAAEQISKLTEVCGGMVMHHNMQSNVISNQDILLGNDSLKKLTVYNTTADLVLKIPADVIEPFMDSLNHLGLFVENRKMDVEDRTLDYLSEKLKAKNRESSVSLRSKMKMTTKVADSILALKDNVVDRKISNLRTNEAARFTTLSLSLYQSNTVSKEIVASDDLSTYNSSVWIRIGLALSRGWFYFSEVLVGILHLWAFILVGLAIWLGISMYRRKKKLIRQPEL